MFFQINPAESVRGVGVIGQILRGGLREAKRFVEARRVLGLQAFRYARLFIATG